MFADERIKPVLRRNCKDYETMRSDIYFGTFFLSIILFLIKNAFSELLIKNAFFRTRNTIFELKENHNRYRIVVSLGLKI